MKEKINISWEWLQEQRRLMEAGKPYMTVGEAKKSNNLFKWLWVNS